MPNVTEHLAAARRHPVYPQIHAMLSADDGWEDIVRTVNRLLVAHRVPRGDQESYMRLVGNGDATRALMVACQFITIESPSGR